MFCSDKVVDVSIFCLRRGKGLDRQRCQKNIMLIGEYKHQIDTKKRLSLPAKFRKELGRRVVITKGLDKCLFLYSPSEWEAQAKRFAALSLGAAEQRSFNRLMFSSAMEVEVDAIGRILVPDYLKEFARLNEKIIVAGVYSRVEIWDQELWREHSAKITASADELAQKLGEVGLI